MLVETELLLWLTMPRLKKLPIAPKATARMADLRYVKADEPGITRRKKGDDWVFFHPDGSRLRKASEIDRIKALVIPPAWTNVWICPDPTGHLHAVGIDQRGRKQYRYHPDFLALRNATKFSRLAAFGTKLPEIRAQVEKDLQLPGLPQRKVLAALVRLLERTSIRVGNEEYARTNESFGLTTLSDDHVSFDGSEMVFEFRGKSGVQHCVGLRDRRLARIVRECQEIPGQDLFQYVDEEGQAAKIRSEDVNAYIRDIAGAEFTAKDFRTWNGTREALNVFRALGPCDSPTAAKKKVVEAVKQVAAILGNRPATCRKYYIHPAVEAAYTEGITLAVRVSEPGEGEVRLLSDEEVMLLNMVSKYVPAAISEIAAEVKSKSKGRKAV